jgi:lipopolysaccharide transport system ATP-binding protein
VSDIAIRVENLGKKYQLGAARMARYTALRDVLAGAVRGFGRRLLRRDRQAAPTEFWALKDVSFEVKQGQCIGVVGRNGAGKSTLLKVLSRITEPTAGRVSIRGRVASLLEVGTGFNPELTGRENIFLNGAILGMKRAEIHAKFDEIVAFAEVEQFIDTPVKYYSSGMYMRLAFAVAAHLEADILLVDEVLAVGDAAFQNKCLGKMNSFSASGRTVFCVSHNLGVLSATCDRGIFLEKGRLIPTDSLAQCLDLYTRNLITAGEEWVGDVGDEHVRVRRARLKHDRPNRRIIRGDAFDVEIDYEILRYSNQFIVGVEIYSDRDAIVCTSHMHEVIGPERCVDAYRVGAHRAVVRVDTSWFAEGQYRLRLDVGLNNRVRVIRDEAVIPFSVTLDTEPKFGPGGFTQSSIVPGWKWAVDAAAGTN